MFGSNPMIAKTFIPAVLEHVKQHMLFYYADLMRLQGREELGEPIEERARKDKTWQSDRDISEALAKASPITFKAIEHTMSGIPPVLQKAQELMQKLMTPPPPADPQSMVAMKELEQRAQEHQADSQLAEKRLELQGQKQQTDAQIKAANQQAAATKTQAQQSLTQTNAELEAQTEIQVQTMKDETEIDKTARNNATALDIAAMEGRNSHLTDGGSMGEK
jgi:predicted RND superfamily exporter protein